MKRLWYRFLLIILLILIPYGVQAESFPEPNGDMIQDEAGVLNTESFLTLMEEVNTNGITYKIVTVTSTSPLSEEEYTAQLFKHFSMDDKSILLLFNAESEKLAGVAGGRFDQQKVSQIIRDKITYYFEPYVTEKNYDAGIRSVLEQLHESLLNEEGIFLEDGETLSAPGNVGESESKPLMPWWMMMLFALLVSLILYAAYSLWQRRRLLSEIDGIDEWKEELNRKLVEFQSDAGHREILHQLKNDLEEISGNLFPEVEEMLIDAEDYCDRLRYGRGWEMVQQAGAILQQVEATLQSFRKRVETNHRLGDDNKRLFEEWKELHRLADKKLHEQRHKLGLSFSSIDERLRTLDEKTEDLKNQLELSEDRQILHETLSQYVEIARKTLREIEEIPSVRKALEEEFPHDLELLKTDIQSFYEDGFEHDEDLNDVPETLQKTWKSIIPLLDEGKIEEVRTRLSSMRDTVDHVYQLMEDAVVIRRELDKLQQSIPRQLQMLQDEQTRLQHEIEDLKERYDIEREEVREYLDQIAVSSQQLQEKYQQAENLFEQEEKDYDKLLEMYRDISKRVEEALTVKSEMVQQMNRLRSGEMDAKEKWQQLRKSLASARQQLKRSNLPGIPDEINNALAVAYSSLEEVGNLLQQSPIPVNKIEHYIEEAAERVDAAVEQIDKAIDYCHKAEETIQHTNRFRASDVQIENLLVRAESAFRSLDFEESYRLASEAQERAVGGKGLKKKWFKQGGS